MKKLRDRVRELTPRTSGQSMEAIIKHLNPVLRGWYGYFKHGVGNTLSRVDSWVRSRLRSILRRRHGYTGTSQGSGHIKYPNAYFARAGLFSLVQARRLEIQSQR